MIIQNSVSTVSLPSQGPTSPAPTVGLAASTDTSGTGGTSPPPTAGQVQQAVNTLNQSSSFLNRDLTFSVDQSTHDTVVKVVEAQTGQVITQIPSKQAMAIAQAISALPQKAAGVLLNQKV